MDAQNNGDFMETTETGLHVVCDAGLVSVM